jgi:hypothetical protein
MRRKNMLTPSGLASKIFKKVFRLVHISQLNWCWAILQLLDLEFLIMPHDS